MAVRLITRTDRDTNFDFTSPRRSSEPRQGGHEFSGLDSIRLNDIEISYQDELSGNHYRFTVDEAQGHGKPDAPLQLSVTGKVATIPYSLDMEGGSLADLLSGDGKWPLSRGRLLIGDVTLQAEGSLSPGRRGEEGFLSLSLEGQNLPDIAALFDVTLADPGPFRVSTQVGLAPGHLHLTGLALESQAGNISGNLAVSLHGSRPLVGGTLFLIPALTQEATDRGAEISNSPEEPKSQEDKETELPWHLLGAVELDLVIKVDDIIAGGIEFSGLRSTVSLVDGELIVPVSMNLFDMKVRGVLEAAAESPQPRVTGRLSTRSADLGPLLRDVESGFRWDGYLGSLLTDGSSRGSSVEDLLENITLSLHLGDSALIRDEQTIVSAEELSFNLRAQEFIDLAIHGELLDAPLEVRARLVDSLLEVDIDACDTSVFLHGRNIDQRAGTSEFELKIDGENACGLIYPLAQFVDKDPDFSAAATGSIANDGISIEVEQARLGDLAVQGHLLLQKGDEDLPRVTGEIRSPQLDLAPFFNFKEEESLQAGAGSEQGAGSADAKQKDYEQTKALLNRIMAMEIAGVKRFLSTDVELKVGVEEILNGMIGVKDVEFSIEAEKGKLRHSPFQVQLGGSLFNGSAAIDLRNEVPSAHLDLETNDFNLPELLQEFDLENIPEVGAAHVGLDMIFEGATVKEMLIGAHYRARLQGGRIKLDREGLTPLLLTIEDADYIAYPNQPAMASVDGEVNSQPFNLESTSSGFFARGTERPVILSMQGKIGDNRIETEGRINRHKESKESFSLSSGVFGTRMDSLNELLGLDLPPLGPYEIEGTLASRAENSVGLYDMGVKIGDSSLWGQLILTTSTADRDQNETKINLQSRLEARIIQLNDFQFEQWSPLAGNQGKEQDRSSEEDPVEKQPSKATYELLSAEVAEKVDAALEIVVQEVLSGDDQLGRGYLEGRLEQGIYHLDELQLNVPGGTVQISGKLQPHKERVAAELLMNIEDFDYGILVRRTRPESTLKGRINLDLDLSSEVEQAVRLSDNLNGRFRFGITPEELSAGGLDLWAVNIIFAALPIMMKGSSSVVNCLAGDFTLEQSLMKPELFLLDTSNMRVSGKGSVNFRTNEIDFLFKPKPKSAQFFSLATPVAVSGSILNPDIGVTTAGVIGTIFRQPLSIITVPLQRLFTENLERDGQKVCSAAMKWVKETGEEVER